MGTLHCLATNREIVLRSRSLIGRSTRNDLQLSAPGASMEHALIHWDGARWVLRDLRSRNGTRLNGRLLLGEPVPLTPNDNITFGDPDERWCWRDSAPPEPRAIGNDGRVVYGQGGLLLLPDEAAPEVSIYTRDGRWEQDFSGQVAIVGDGAEIRAGERSFRLDLPTCDVSDFQTQALTDTHERERCRIIFDVSSDEEHVRVTLEVDRVAQELTSHASHYMLLLLARARIHDVRRGVTEPDSGWVYADELAEQLRTSPETVNVWVHRARRCIQRATSGAARGAVFDKVHNLIERRRLQLRVGIASITIRRANGAVDQSEPARI